MVVSVFDGPRALCCLGMLGWGVKMQCTEPPLEAAGVPAGHRHSVPGLHGGRRDQGVLSGHMSIIGRGDAWSHLSQEQGGRVHSSLHGGWPSSLSTRTVHLPGTRAQPGRVSKAQLPEMRSRASARLNPAPGHAATAGERLKAPPCPRSWRRRGAVVCAAHQRRGLRPGLLQPACPACRAPALRATPLQGPHQVRPRAVWHLQWGALCTAWGVSSTTVGVSLRCVPVCRGSVCARRCL